jgi:tripartite-type tricarboxylate transporter receptor subunit TctC
LVRLRPVTTDTFARLIAQRLMETLGQSFSVENRPGGIGNIGAMVLARGKPDGYTFLVSSSRTLIINPIIFHDLPFDAES